MALLTCLLATPAVAQDDAQNKFDQAQLAIEEGRLRSARQTLEELLAEQPNLQRVRLELARVHYLSYDYDEAERLAQQVLDDPNTPLAVQTTVLAFLAQIREDQKRLARHHSVIPSLYVGTLYDSNVNFGPSRDIIDIGGIPFQVLPGSQEVSDWALVINPAVAYNYNIGKPFQARENNGFLVWQVMADAYYRRYFNEEDFNFGVVTLRTGPAWVVPGHWRASIGLQGDQTWLGDDSLAFFTSINPNVAWELSENTGLLIDASITQRHYWQDINDGRDGWHKWAALSIDHIFNDGMITVNGGVGYADFAADDDRFSYLGPEAFASIGANAWRNGYIYLRGRYKKYDFEGIEPGFGVSRNDDEYRVILGFQQDFIFGMKSNWSILGDWGYTKNNSPDTPIYDYDRNEINIGFSHLF